MSFKVSMEGSESATDSTSDINFANLAIAKLPRSIKQRVQALKKIQRVEIDIEAEFCMRIEELEAEFAEKFGVLFEKRRQIVTGEVEPTDEESDYPLLSVEDHKLQLVNESGLPEPEGGTVGIPDFWLTALKNALWEQGTIKACDEPILKYLVDVSYEVFTAPFSYTLYFHFAPNEYFTQKVLKKTYFLKLTPDEDDPFSYDGPIVIRAEGTLIDWKEGQDVTKKVVLVRQRSASGGTRRTAKVIKNPSFFNFFDPPPVESVSDDEESAESTKEALVADFALGQFFRDELIPRAALFFTGEQVIGDDDEDDEDDDGDYEYDGDYDEVEGDEEDEDEEETEVEKVEGLSKKFNGRDARPQTTCERPLQSA